MSSLNHLRFRSSTLVAVAVAFACVGCQKSATPVAANTDPKPAINPVTAPPDSTTPSKTDSNPSKPNTDQPIEETPVTHGDPIVQPDKGKHYATKAAPLPNQVGTHGWEKLKTTPSPLELAQKADAQLADMDGAEGDGRIRYVLPTGTGNVITDCKFSRKGQYSVQYPIIEDGHPTLRTVHANAGQLAIMQNSVPDPGKGKKKPNAWSAPMPMPKEGEVDGAVAAKNWPTQMPQLAMSQFITGKKVFTPLIKSIMSGTGSYNLVSEERTTSYHSKLITDYRIVATRKPALAKKYGRSEFEIVFDGTHHVPLTMRTRLDVKNQRATMIDWVMQYHNGKFTPADFALPQPSRTL